jgi:DNA helicase IV
METHKHNLLEKLRVQIRLIQGRITESMESTKTMATKSLREIGSMQPADQVVYMQLKGYAVDRMEQLEHLHKSPFFTKCEIIDTETQEKKSVFFATHQYIDSSIYSWTSPVASIRFESLGDISYKLPSGEYKKITILQREQYMIVDGKVIFYAQENPGTPRELIYQEHFTKQKSEFILPEIVAQMEKAQDAVIRAAHRGPLVISGPAGSGKTTLALHRVAYLTQAPDTASMYSPESIIVFVQDSGTKEYFSHLLPGLGIHNVNITTFPEWAMKILGLSGYEYIHREGNTEQEKDLIEYKKIHALRSERPFTIPKNAKVLDRLDITMLLKEYLKKHDRFETVRQFDAVVKGVIRKKKVKKSIEYSLLVVDEFQNYLPEQLSILKRCLRTDTQSVVYVGDMGQQVYLGTIKKWEQIGEVILPERNIRLDKVYRNTKNILQFIQALGYIISIPEGIKEGPAVVEKIFETVAEEIAYIKSIMNSYREGSIGVVAKDDEYLAAFKNEFQNDYHVHVLTMKESQGVEFDLVCIVGVDQEILAVSEYAGVSTEHLKERKQIQKDLLYVALTRAITELHVMGRVSLARVKV